MIQPDPTVVGERQISNHECVPASLTSALQDCGRSDQVADVVAWLTSNGFDTSSGVRIEGAAAYCDHIGVPYDVDDGNVPMSSYVPAALAAGFPVIGFHQCDGGAHPVAAGSGNILHCRRFYGNDGAYQTMNPWPPALESVATATMDAADVRVHLTIHLPVVGATVEDSEDDMFTLSWDWPEKLNGTQRQRMVTCTGDGQLWERFYDDDPSNPATIGWKKAVMPQADGKNLPGTLTKMRSGSQWHIFNVRSDGTTGHWFQGDTDPDWGYDTCDGTTMIVPALEDAIVALIRELPQATGGGWTAAQQAEIDAIKAAIGRIESGLKGA